MSPRTKLMMPTCEFVGCLADVLPAAGDKDYESLHAVQIVWTGEKFYAQATDRSVIARSYWDEGVEPDRDVDEDMFVDWGSADDPWSAVISWPDAKDLVAKFKLPPKLGWAALSVEYVNHRYVRVTRSRDTGLSQLVQQVDARPELTNAFPADMIAEVLYGRADAWQIEQREIAYPLADLSRFAGVRPRGPIALTFYTNDKGRHGATRVTVGERFVGAVLPIRDREEDREARTAARIAKIDGEQVLDI